MRNTIGLLLALFIASSTVLARPISEVMPSGGSGFDPWNQTRWADWYDQSGTLIEPFEIDVSVTFAEKSSSWWFDPSQVARITGGLSSVFVVMDNSDITIDGNGVVIDGRPAADLGRSLLYYYITSINLDDYSDENCFIFNQSDYTEPGAVGSRLHNITLTGFSRGVAFHHDHRRQVTLENVNFVRDIWGVFPRGQNGTVTNCLFKENVMGGFYCEYNSYDWVITQNTFKDNNTRGVKSYGDIVIDACRAYEVTDNIFQPSTYDTRPYNTAISLYRNRGENEDVRELAPKDILIAGNSFDGFHIGIDFAPRQAQSSNNDNSEETRCYTMDNIVQDNTFSNCIIGIVLRSNYTTITQNTFNNTDIDIALLNMFYSIHHNTIDEPGDDVWLWATPDDYTSCVNNLGYTSSTGSAIPKSQKLFHIICPSGHPVVHNYTDVAFLIADSLAVPDRCDVNSDLVIDTTDLTSVAQDWLSSGTIQPFTQQTTDIVPDSYVDLGDYSACAADWLQHSARKDFYSADFKMPLDVAVGDMAVFEAGDEIAVIWDQPVSNVSGTDYYTIAIFDQRGNELDRCGRSTKRWSKIVAGNFLPDGGWIPQDENYEIAAISSEPDDNGKYPIYIFHKGFMEPSVVLQPNNTTAWVAITAGNFTTATDDYDEIAVKGAGTTEIVCLKPSDPAWSETVVGAATNIIDIEAGEFDGRASQDEIAAITDGVGPVLIYKTRIAGVYKTCADYGKQWRRLAVGSFDGQPIRENIVVTEADSVDDDILGYWTLQENSGQYAYSAPNGPTLRRGSSGTSWQDPQWSSEGYRGSCLYFESIVDGPDGAIDILRPEAGTDVSDFQTDTFTIEAWIKLDSIPTGDFDWYNPYTILSFGGKDSQNDNKDAYFLRITRWANGTGLLNGYYYTADDTGTSVIHSAELETDRWYHVAFAHDGSSATDNISIWVDGVEEVSSSSLHPRTDLTVTGESLCVGAMWTRKRGFDGHIDQLRITNRRLATDELLVGRELNPGCLYYFTDTSDTPFLEQQLAFLGVPTLSLDAGRLYAESDTSMYLTTQGITKDAFYLDHTTWENALFVFPSQPAAYSAPGYWVGLNSLNTSQSCYRLVPIMR